MWALIKKAASEAFSFFSGLSLKAWFYLIVVIFYALSCWYFDHRGYSKGVLYTTNKYNQGTQKDIEKQEKQNDRNAQEAITKEKDLSTRLTTLQSQKEALQRQLDLLTKQKSTDGKSPNNEKSKEASTTSTCSCSVPSSDSVHSLQDAINKANQ